jgi:NAD(P)-dependent dehydrogenase (short-subunit alcohol dehydrogenase family)
MDPVVDAIGRLLSAEELCATVRFLCLSDVRFMTGTTLVLDGGFTALSRHRLEHLVVLPLT